MLTVEIDGNDGTGKTYLINRIKEYMFNNFHYDWKLNRDIIYEDRGVLSAATLSDEWNKENPDVKSICTLNTENILYILVDDIPEKCQERILKRGDSIEEEYHTLHDLQKYRDRFKKLRNAFCQDIMYIEKNGNDFSEDTIRDIAFTIVKKHNFLLRKEIIETSMLLNAYKERYGDIDLRKYIRVTKTNLQTTLLPIDYIVKFTPDHGLYQGIEYNTKIVCKDHTHYVIESIETVRNLYKDACSLYNNTQTLE